MREQTIEKLFAYGTLRHENVQINTFGRKLTGKEDAIIRFKLSMVSISDPDVIAASGETEHPILIYTGNENDLVPGVVFDVSPNELAQADEYEVSDYERISVILSSGARAWVYAKKGQDDIEKKLS